jgi:hypothetical protein
VGIIFEEQDKKAPEVPERERLGRKRKKDRQKANIKLLVVDRLEQVVFDLQKGPPQKKSENVLGWSYDKIEPQVHSSGTLCINLKRFSYLTNQIYIPQSTFLGLETKWSRRCGGNE